MEARHLEPRAGWLCLPTLLLILVGCSSSTAPEAPRPRPNIVLISIDTLRADALSCYGCEDATSPNLDRLAAGGVLFESVSSTSSWTLPAHLSMLTGLSVSAHGICDERLWSAVGTEGGPDELPLRGDFLAESLGRSGYTSGGFYSWKYLAPNFGFGQGFETWSRVGNTVWDDGPRKQRYEALTRRGDQAALKAWIEAEPEAFDQQAPGANLVVDAGLDWVDRRGPEPFFLFLHIFDVHDDYVPPAPFDSAFDADYEGPIDGTKVSSVDSKVHAGMPARDLRHLQALYHGEVAWVDSQLGRLFDELEARGLSENTIIAITADHGDEFYEHGHKTHRTQLYRETTEVPLIFSWPGHLPAGARIAGPVGIVDIAPTLSALANVAPPVSVSGRDLSRVMRAEEPNAETTYLSELMLFKTGSPTPERQTALRRGSEHWIRIVDRQGQARGVFFDRAANPLEVGPGTAFGPASPRMARFDELLAPVRQSTQAQRDAAPSRADLFAELGTGVTEELAAMGYLGGDAPVEMQDSSRLCLDGCFSKLPASSPPNSQ